MIAAEQHACRLVVPSSQQFGAKRWPSHRDHAAKALHRLAGPHLPASLKQLEKAITRARAELSEAQEQAFTASRKPTVVACPVSSASGDVGDIDGTGAPVAAGDVLEEVDDAAVDEQMDDNDVVDVAGALTSDGHVHSDVDSLP